MNETENAGLCVVVPALNEEAVITDTVETIVDQAERNGVRLQILLVNDGSTDQTSVKMAALAERFAFVTVVQHESPGGLHKSFRTGVAAACAPYLTVIPGDNAFGAEGIGLFFAALGKADMVVTYREDQRRSRTLTRYALSGLYTMIMTVLFGGGLRDYHSMVAYPVDKLRSVTLRAEGPPYQIEAIVKVLRLRPSIVQVPVNLNPRLQTRSSALRWRTVQQLAVTILALLLRR